MLDPDTLMEANGLSFAASEVDGNPYMPQDSSDMRHWLCSVSGSGLPGFEFYVSLEADAATGPSASLALSLVIEDVRAYRECGGYSDFAKMIGIEDDDPAGGLAWAEIGRLAPLAEAFLDLGSGSVPSPS